jgi:predicted MFS family arabinose efflux permease
VLNWQAVFLICAPLILLAAIATSATLRTSHWERTASYRSVFAAMPTLLIQPKILALYGSTMAVLGSFVAIYTAVTLTGPPSIAGNADALFALRASALPAMIAVPLITPLLARTPALTRVAASLGLAAVAAVAASMLGSNAVALGAMLLVFVGALAVAAPAIVEAIGAMAGTARGAAIALYAFSMFVGASLGPQLASALAGLGFGGIVRAVAIVPAVGALLAIAARRRRA